MSAARFDPTPWTGRVDVDDAGSTLRWHQAVRSAVGVGPISGVALCGLASDEGVRRNHGRTGAAAGPAALRRALANLALPQAAPLWDAGDVAVAGSDLEAAQDAYADVVADLLTRGATPVGLGGGHEIAWGTWTGLWRARRPRRAVVVNLDAHLDLRAGEVATSGTPFRQIVEHAREHNCELHYACIGVSKHANTAALFARADAWGATTVHDDALDAASLPAVLRRLDGLIAHADVFLSICLDVLPPWVSPGVSAPSGRGVELPVIAAVVRHLLNSGRVSVVDVAELCPPHDPDGRTARVAARLVADVAHAVWGEP